MLHAIDSEINRILVKFHDLNDGDEIYQVKFSQKNNWKDRLSINENLTDQRTRMASLPSEMQKRQSPPLLQPQWKGPG